jgi:hypothetical protein
VTCHRARYLVFIAKNILFTNKSSNSGLFTLFLKITHSKLNRKSRITTLVGISEKKRYFGGYGSRGEKIRVCTYPEFIWLQYTVSMA